MSGGYIDFLHLGRTDPVVNPYDPTTVRAAVLFDGEDVRAAAAATVDRVAGGVDAPGAGRLAVAAELRRAPGPVDVVLGRHVAARLEGHRQRRAVPGERGGIAADRL